MRVLVTGREGQLARSLTAVLAASELILAARPELDLADFASIEAVVEKVRPDLIVNAAAYTAVDRAEAEPEMAMRINGEAPGVLARAAARVGARVIQVSTDYVFDGTGSGPYRESDPIAPLGAYGRSKAAGEDAVRASGADHAIVRTAWVYSPFGSNFVKTMLRIGAERAEVTVVADQVGCPTSAADLAQGLARIVACWQAEPRRATQGTYHLAGSGETSWAGFATAIFAASGAVGGPCARVVPISTAQYPTAAPRPANSRLDCTRFAATFGYAARDWREALPPVVETLLG